MTVVAAPSFRYHATDGATRAFAAPFCYRPADLVVFVTLGAERTDLVLGQDYEVLDAGLGTARIWTSETYPAGMRIWAYRRLPREQLSHYTETGRFPALTVERDFDRLWLVILEIEEALGRAFMVSDQTEPGQRNQSFPPPDPGRVLGWLDDGTLGNLVGGGDGSAQLHGLEAGTAEEPGPDQSAALEALITARIAAGIDHLILTAPRGQKLLIGRRSRIRNFARPFLLDLSGVEIDMGADGEITGMGRLRELPLTNLYRLAGDLDASSGDVVTIPIDLSPRGGDPGPLTAGARLIMRGQNDANSDALPGHRFETTIESTELIDGVLHVTAADPVPATVPGGIWKVLWPDSEHPSGLDHTLISVVAETRLTADATDARVVAVEDAGLLEPGDWVVATDDQVGADHHGSSRELLHEQLVRVARVDTEAGEVELEHAIEGALLVASRARLILADPVQPIAVIGPRELRRIAPAQPSPASRRHFLEVRYGIRPRITGVWFDFERSPHDSRGAVIRTSACYDPQVWGNAILSRDPAYRDTGGDIAGIWDKRGWGGRWSDNAARRCRHGLTFGGSKRALVAGNVAIDCWQSNIDFHGENERHCLSTGNRIVAGAAVPGRPQQEAEQYGNPTHTYGSHGCRSVNNSYVGFDAPADVGAIVYSGCSGIQILDPHAPGAGTVVRIQADRRAPAVPIRDIAIRGDSAGGAPIVIDGRMPAWTAAGSFEGSAARPTFCEHAGHLWSTVQSGEAGTTPPAPGGEPEIGVTTHDDGGLLWTYRGLVAWPIERVTVEGSITGAAVPIAARRVLGLALDRLRVTSALGPMVLHDCPGVVLRDPDIGPRAADAAWADFGGTLNGGRIIHPAIHALETTTGDYAGDVVTHLLEAGGEPEPVEIGHGAEWVQPAVEGGVAIITADMMAFGAAGSSTAAKGIRLLNEGSPGTGFTARLPYDATPFLSQFVFMVDEAQTGLVTVEVAGHGADADRRIDGQASIEAPPAGSLFGLVCDRNPGGEKARYRSTVWGRVFARPVRFDAGIHLPSGSASGALTTAVHGGRVWLMTGNCTVPADNEFTVTLISAGSYTVGAGGTPISLAAGECVSVMVAGDTVYHTPPVELDTLAQS